MRNTTHTASTLRSSVQQRSLLLHLLCIVSCALYIFFLSFPVAVRADTGNPPSDARLLEGARLCTRYLPQSERHYGIPSHLLTAIAATESGRYNSKLKMALPWPWTVNAEGKGYYFDSKREAVAAVKRFQRQGISSIDVGCMQVNLHHHSEAFDSVSQAFEPRYNVAYAARFLRENYDKDHSWRQAAGSYHSRTEGRGEKYSGKVFKNWRKILKLVSRSGKGRKVAARKKTSGKKDSSAQYAVSNGKNKRKNKFMIANNSKDVADAIEAKPALMLKYLSPPGVKILDANKKNGMRVIRHQGVRVVRPIRKQSEKSQVEQSAVDVKALKSVSNKYKKISVGQKKPKSREEAMEMAKKMMREASESAISERNNGQFRPATKSQSGGYVSMGNVTTRVPSVASKSLFVFK